LIKLGNKAITALKANIASQAPEGQTLVFAETGGEPIRDRTLYRDFKQILEEAGLRNIRFHDLRHADASLMLNYGVPVSSFSGGWGMPSPASLWMCMGTSFPAIKKRLPA
jgi:site-specific recombinase XerD